MTQQAVTPYTFYVADGFGATFPYPWRIGAANDLEVYLQETFTTAYSVTGIDNDTGGNVVLYNPPPAGQIVFIRRVTPQTQLYDPVANDPFDPGALEFALDKIVRDIQDLAERISRSPQFALTTTNAYRNMVLPTPVALKLLGFDATGTAFTLYDPSVTQVQVDYSSGEAHGITTATVASVGGAEFLTASGLIPAGVKVKGVGYRVLTTLSNENSLASVNVGGMGLTTGWGASLGRTQGSINNEGHMRADEPRTVASHDVILTPNPPGALFGATGAVKLTCFWRTLAPAY